MTNTPEIPVRGQIRLGQFLKLAGLAEDGAQARELVQSGYVRFNGATEVRRCRRLSPGDLDEVDAHWGSATPSSAPPTRERPPQRPMTPPAPTTALMWLKNAFVCATR